MEQKDNSQLNTQSNGQSLHAQAQNDFYHKHLAVSVISKKTEKIVTAIYMVTDFVPESEPLRTHLRTLGLSLISGTRRIGARSSEPLYALADEVNRTIDETNTMLTLATSEKMLQTFDKGQEIYKGQNATVGAFPQPRSEAIQVPKRSFEPVAKKHDIGIKIARRNDVLNVIKSKGRASIKDVVSLLKDISEKTVQRELLALVKEGVLVKEGEKRWSTYRVAS